MFKTALEVVESFCAYVQTLKESVLFGMTKPVLPSTGEFTTHLHSTVQPPRFSLWFELLPAVL